jgi:protein-tyrosine phosphatase
LTSLKEIEEKSPEYANEIKKNNLSCPKRDYPIQDFSIPSETDDFFEFIKDTASEIKKGKKILVHCAGGVGRTGTFAVCLLQELGSDHSEALKLVDAAGSGPETLEQQDLIFSHAEATKKSLNN